MYFYWKWKHTNKEGILDRFSKVERKKGVALRWDGDNHLIVKTKTVRYNACKVDF
ncbi:hypothetical protein EfmJHP35_13590 [Enterococcus faecium]|nr:hypothetical protein EfmJHP35_13590 [Enterococcus faecium]